MNIHNSSYKNKKIIIDLINNKPQLEVDRNIVKTGYDEDAKKYFCSLLPYKKYGSLVDLAKDCITRSEK